MSFRHAAFLLLLSSAIVGLGSCSSDRERSAQSPETVRHVSVVAVQSENIPDLLEATGTVSAAQTSSLASQMMGTMLEIRVREGDRVQRGQVLAVIDDSQPRAAMDRAVAADHAAQQQLAAAEADLSLAESTLKRYQTLYEKKSVSPQEFDEIKNRQALALSRRDVARAEQAQAKAAIAQARTSLDYARIRAPFDGVVTEKKADPGTLASPGAPVFTVEDVRRYRLETAINENDLRYLRTGQRVPVRIDALGDAELTGRVVQIVPAADAATHTFLVKIELPADSRLRSGLFGRAQFSRGLRQSLLIPRSAIMERGQLKAVFILDPDRVAALRYITLGKPLGDSVEVLAGLQSGERLVTKPGELDLAGKRVEAEQ